MSETLKLKNEESAPNLRRTPQEVKKRIEELEGAIKMNDVWIHTGIISQVPEPNSWRKREILEAKLQELRWALGEDNKITDGLS